MLTFSKIATIMSVQRLLKQQQGGDDNASMHRNDG